jgi:hypothetical protein
MPPTRNSSSSTSLVQMRANTHVSKTCCGPVTSKVLKAETLTHFHLLIVMFKFVMKKMKIIKLYVLGLLLLSSFNVLGEKECNIITNDNLLFLGRFA